MDEILISKGLLVQFAQQKLDKTDIYIKNGIIEKIGCFERDQPDNLIIIDADQLYISPGLIDIQVNGGVGYNFVESPRKSSIKKIFSFYLSHGATGLLLTTISKSISRLRRTLSSICKSQSYLGIHLEGPFLSLEKKGAHSSKFIQSPSGEEFKKLIAGYGNRVKLVTFAPELNGADDLLNEITRIGAVPSIGHSNATYEQAMSALNKGAESFTHLFNAMSGFHHRKPGCVGAALDSDAYVGLICDGLHVHPAGIRLALKTKGIDKICLVTDAISAAGMGDGKYTLGDQTVIVKEGVAKLPDGTLAGSTLTMDQAVKNFMEFTGVILPQAVRAASLNPARLLGIDDRKGSIEEGKDADLVIFDQDFNVHYTIIGGEVVYRRED